MPIPGIVWDPREPLPPAHYAPRAGVRHFESSRAPNPDFRNVGDVHSDVKDLVIRQADRNILPPLSVSLTAQIIQDAAKVTVTQLFWNTTTNAIRKGSYTFPLPAGCTVTDFSCRVARNKIIRARVKPKQEARDAFDDSLRNKRMAGLLEQNTPEIFTTTLGNIPANTELKAEISFITLLKHRVADTGSITILTIPTYIAPRYGDPPPGLQTAALTGISQGLAVQVEIITAESVREISSSTHPITVERGVGRTKCNTWRDFAAADGEDHVQTATVRLKDGSTFLDRDFVLDIATQPQNGLEAPHAWLESHPSFGNHRAIMLTIPPNLMFRNEPATEDAEIIFVADRSGSMDDKMNSLKSAMTFFLKGIPQGRRFNIWCFGSNHSYLWPNSRDYSQEALGEALAFVAQYFRSDMGGTELLPALKAIVMARDRSRMTDIIVLTDGEVWGLDETINFIQQTRTVTEGSVRFFALGVGNAVSHELVEGIAKAGGGYAEVIPAASQGGWEDRVVAMLSAALAAHLGPLQIELEDRCEDEAQAEQSFDGALASRRPRILQSPADISTLSPFLRNRVFLFFNFQQPSNHIIIKATTPSGKEIVTRVAVKPLEKRDISIHKLGARALLGDLERGQSWIQLDPNGPARDSTKEEALVRCEGEYLGCKWSLVSKWTSFYAIEEPYEADENMPEPFLDFDPVHIRQTADGMDLLRPRDPHGLRADGPILSHPKLGPAQVADKPKGDDDTNEDPVDLVNYGNNSVDNRFVGHGAEGTRGNLSGGKPCREREFFPSRLSSGAEDWADSPEFGSATLAWENLSGVSATTVRKRKKKLRSFGPVKNLPHSAPRLFRRPGTIRKEFVNASSSNVFEHDDLTRNVGECHPSSAPLPTLAPGADSGMQKATPKSNQERDGEQIIRKLVDFQEFDGSFKLGGDTPNQLKIILGVEFVSAVCDIHKFLGRRAPDEGKELAATVAMIVLLELKFQLCKDLWTMVVTKARHYIDRRLISRVTMEKVWDIARERLQNLQVPAQTNTSNPLADADIPMPSIYDVNPPFPQDELHEAFAKDRLPNGQVAMSGREPTDFNSGSNTLSDALRNKRSRVSRSEILVSMSQPTQGEVVGKRVALDTAPLDD